MTESEKAVREAARVIQPKAWGRKWVGAARVREALRTDSLNVARALLKSGMLGRGRVKGLDALLAAAEGCENCYKLAEKVIRLNGLSRESRKSNKGRGE